MAFFLRQERRPGAPLFIGPCLVCEESHLARPEPEAQHIIEMEILELVGADYLFGLLRRHTVGALFVRHQLRRYLGIEDGLQDGACGRVELARLDDPADQVLDKGLGHRGIDVVVRHMVADAVGGPAQGELAQVAGAEHDGLIQIRQAEEMRRALPCLDVFEGDVINRLAAGVGMPDVLEYLHARRPDIDLFPRYPEGLHQAMGVLVRLRAGGEAGHGIGKDMRAW